MITGLETAIEHYELVEALIRISKPEVVIETGTAGGIGTHKIAAALDRNETGHVWTVDNRPCEIEPHDRITVVEQDSLTFVEEFDKHVDFAFVDCAFSTRRQDVVDCLIGKGADLIVLDDAVAYGTGGSDLFFIGHGAGLSVWQRNPEPIAISEPPDWRRI
jgi:predicted O-methyltransferase YrrM